MKNILICERFALEAQMKLKVQPNFAVMAYNEERLATAHALVIRSKFRITKELLEKGPALELIVTCTSGFDHIDLAETQKRNVTVMYTPDANAQSAAELTWALLMSANRKVQEAHQNVKKHNWEREPLLGHELSGKTLGLAGLGRIGQKVAHISKAFGMHLLAFDPYVGAEAFATTGAQRCSYEELLKKSDFLSFHVPGTKETRNMFNAGHHELVPPEIIVINTSRGQVINEDDLAKALNEGRIRYAALDVFNKEPLGYESKLTKCKNILLTPHVGAFTEEAFQKASNEASDRVIEFFEFKKTRNTLPLQNDWGLLSFAERT